MSASHLLPNPCLLGLVFCISTHDGNQLVFHYPPNPNEYGFKPTPLLENHVLDTGNIDLSSSSSSESESLDFEQPENYSDAGSMSHYSRGSFSTDSVYSTYHYSATGSHKGSFETKHASGKDILEMMDERDRRRKRKAKRRVQKFNSSLTADNEDLINQSVISSKTLNSTGNSLVNDPVQGNLNHMTEKDSNKIETLFSFDIDFISDLATPPKALCNNKFELTVEDMVFLGLPIRVDDDGNWRSSKKKKTTRKSVSTRNKGSRRESVKSEELSKVKTHETNEESDKEGESEHVTETSKDNGMYQFNLLFVMNPPVVEYNHRIDEMFHYVVSRLSLLLRYEQQNNNYVWEESQKILKLKEELADLPVNNQWDQIIEKTSLGKLIYQTYESISKSEILNVEINGRLRSFQIPIKTVFSSIPERTLEIPPASTLSSVSPFNELTNVETPAHLDDNGEIMVHFALILMDDVESIISDIRVDRDSVFASFIRMIKPSESLSRLSVLSGLGIQEVKLFANHLVYWRRAKAFLPISSRNIYIVSPLAPVKQVYEDSSKFNRHFPTLPPLTTFLAMISGISHSKPKPISTIIPTKDHRDLYLEAIAWLLKYGYVVHLCSFLYLKISKEIKIEVDEEIEIEVKKKQELLKKRQQSNHAYLSDEQHSSGYDTDDSILQLQNSDVGSEDNINAANTQKTTTSNSNTANNAAITSMPAITYNITDKGDIKDSVAIVKDMNTDNTAELSANATGFLITDDQQNLKTEEMRGAPVVEFEEEEEEDTILTEPEYATALERRWIAKIVSRIPPESVGLFYKLLKYMNGKKAVELFLLQENVARQDLRRLMDSLADQLVVVRHW